MKKFILTIIFSLLPLTCFAAPQYFIGVINGNWSQIGNWSATSGGLTNGTIPANGDDVFLDGNSPACTLDVNSNKLNSFDMTGYTNTFSMDGNAINVVPANNTTVNAKFVGTVTNANIYMDSNASNTATINFYSGGNTFNNVGIGTINSSNPLVEQMDNLTASYLHLQYGGLATNNYSLNLHTFAAGFVSGQSLNLGNSSITISSGWDMSVYAGTFTAGTSVISNSGTYFYGNGYNFYGLYVSSSSMTISGSNSFNTFSITTPSTVKFTAGTTQTFTGEFSSLGTSGNTITLESTSNGSAYTLAKKYIGASWNVGANSTLVSGDTGLTVGASPEMNIDYNSIQDCTGTIISASTNHGFARFLR